MRTELVRLPGWAIRFVRFGVTGVGATLVHVAIATTLIVIIHLKPYVANPIAFICATGFSYAINSRWSFADRSKAGTAPRFLLVSCVGCVTAAAVSAAAESMQLDYRIGILWVIVVVTPMTFILHNRWTYGLDR